MPCPRCGRELLPESRFCSWCGLDLRPRELDEDDIVAAAVAEPVPAPRPKGHPWLRYFARCLDMTIYLMVVVAVLSADLGISQDTRMFVAGFLSYLMMVFTEAVLLHQFGTTPGKWLFHIHVATTSGALRPSFRQALNRTFLVWVRGLGLGLPIIGAIAVIYNYVRLKSEGETSWDRDSGCEILHQPITLARLIFIVISFVVACVLLASMLLTTGFTAA